MQHLSVIIVCKNEADIIGKTLESLYGLTDDIILYDNGSTDNTLEIAGRFNVAIHQGLWEGYGKTKQTSMTFAKYDWILSLDADEAIDDELKQSLLTLKLTDEKAVYVIKFKNFLGNKYLKYGEWGGDKHIRLFNRKTVSWNNEPVHEKLVIPVGSVINRLSGYILHRTIKDVEDYATKTINYAMLSAEKYHKQGKRVSLLKCWIASGFAFFKYYILKAGFLDGYYGYICAKMTAHYTFLKYIRLKELEQ